MMTLPATTTGGRLRAANSRLLTFVALAIIAPAVLVPAAAWGATTAGGWYHLKDGKLPSPGYTDVDFVTATKGWAVGVDGTIAVTSNGGMTWRSQESGISADLASVAFSDPAHGWAVCESGILGTTDGGANWNLLRSTTEDCLLRGIACTDASHAWAIGADKATHAATILSTSDGGANWTKLGVSDVGQYPNNGLYGVTFLDASHGWAVGEGGTIVTTGDGGGIWTTQRASTAGQSRLKAVTFVDAFHGWAVGDGGTILFTTDGGTTWARQDSWTTSSFADVWFADASHGWAVGWDGISATSNGGQDWKAQPLSFFVGPLQAITFANARCGWAVSCWGDVIVTYSAGAPDTRGPVTYARDASGRRGKSIALKYKITDNYCPRATAVKIVIRSGSRRVRTYSFPTKTTGVWHSVKWKPKARGAYRYFVYARDMAGNRQSRVGGADVRVR